MQFLNSPISIRELSEYANCMNPSGDPLVKAVVDVSTRQIIIGATMHVDEEEMFLDMESEQSDLWGINLYPAWFGNDTFIEYDSMINLRPLQKNFSRSVEDPEIQNTITDIVLSYVTK
jgi:Protein of unknown function (DUF5674)